MEVLALVVLFFLMAGHSAHAQCNINARARTDCGFGGITRAQCVAKGCCYDDRIIGVPWCFFSGDSEGSLNTANLVEGAPSSQPPYRPTSAAIQFSGSCLFHCTSIQREERIRCGDQRGGEEACLRIGCCYDNADFSDSKCYFPAGLDRPCPSPRCQIPSGSLRLCVNRIVSASACQRLGCCSGRFSDGSQRCYREEDPPRFLGSVTPPSSAPPTTTTLPTTTTEATTTRRPSFIEMLRRHNGGSLRDISVYDMLSKSLNQLIAKMKKRPKVPTTPTTTTTTVATTTTIATTTRVPEPTTTLPPPSYVQRCNRWGRCQYVPKPTQAPRQCFPTECGRPRFYPGSTVRPPVNSLRKVVGGTRAHPFSHPWTAMILKTEGNRKFLCGATVICSRWLVTAAHCMNRQSQRSKMPDLDAIFYKIYVGRYVGWKQKYGKQVQVFDGRDGIEYLEQHDQFVTGVNRGIVTHDIGVIRLRRPIIFNEFVQPACLPNVRPEINKLVWATGWGITKNRGPPDSTLKQVAIRILNKTVCQEEVPRFNSSNPVGVLCAGGERFHDTCTGDSGGPLVGPKVVGVDRRRGLNIQRWQLYGLTSLGSPSCNTLQFNRQPALYTDIAYYLPWIRDRTNGCCDE